MKHLRAKAVINLLLFTVGVILLPALHQAKEHHEDHNSDDCAVCAIDTTKAISSPTYITPIYQHTQPQPVICANHTVHSFVYSQNYPARAPPSSC